MDFGLWQMFRRPGFQRSDWLSSQLTVELKEVHFDCSLLYQPFLNFKNNEKASINRNS